MEKRSNGHLLLFTLHHHIKTKMYAICASYGFARSKWLLNNKVAYEKQRYHIGGTAPKSNRKIVEDIVFECER